MESSIDKTIYLTFDMEWANDTVLEYLYRLLKKEDVPATVFVTHDTNWLNKFREDSNIELGIHPNFNKILFGEDNTGNYRMVIDELMEIVPEAKSYRSHSLTDSSSIILYCVEKGLENNLNTYYFPNPGTSLLPFERSGISMIPFIFEDDLWLLDFKHKEIDYYLSEKFKAFRIFNFHPIQLYLNTASYDRYEKAKVYNHEADKLKTYRNREGWGIEKVFAELIEQARAKGFRFGLMKDLKSISY